LLYCLFAGSIAYRREKIIRSTTSYPERSEILSGAHDSAIVTVPVPVPGTSTNFTIARKE
jgi:hypothetical protein